MNKFAAKSLLSIHCRTKFTAISFAALALGAHGLRAQTVYFDPSGATSAAQTGTWSTTAATWNTAIDGSGTIEAFPTGGDAVFSLTTTTANPSTVTTTTSTVTMGSAIMADSITFATGATTITGAYAITVGANGITVDNGASGSIGNGTGTTTVTTTVGETWTNNSATTLIVGGGSIGGGTTQGTGLVLNGGNIELGNTGQNNLFAGSGSITVEAGTLTIGGGGTALGGRNVYLVSGTIATLANKEETGLNLFLEGNFASSIGGNGATPAASLTLDGNYTLTANASSYTVVNVIQNGASGTILNVGGTGTVAITGNSTYTGGTTIGTGAAFSIGAGTTTGDLTIGGTVTGYTGGTVSDSGTLQFNRSNAYSFNGLVTGTGGISQIGSGTTTLTDTVNSYTGVTEVTGGILSVNTLNNGGTNSSIGAAANTAGELIIAGGTLQYTGAGGSTDHLFQIGLSGTGGGAATLDASGTGAITFSNTGSLTYGPAGKPATLTFTGTSTALNTFAPKIPDDKYTNVIKTGVGTWALTNANTYSAGTTVSAGTLLANNTTGSATGSGVVTVTGGTLGGSGIINSGANAINIGNGTTGGTITGGAVGAVGMLTLTTTATTGVVFNGASGSLSTYAVDLSSNGMTSDNLKINGALTLTGSYDHITVTGTPTVSSLDLINYTGTSLTSGFTEAANDLPAGYTLAYNTDEIDLVSIASVPEPSTWAAGCLSLGLAGWALQKRRRAAKWEGLESTAV